jgi:hypothetical protein
MKHTATISVAAGLVLALCSLGGSATAGTIARDIPTSYIFTPAGGMSRLAPHATYRATTFPIQVRVTGPEPGWLGAQWRSGDDYFRGGGPPHYGWLHLGRGTPTGIPQGLISIMTAYAGTPSVAAVEKVLRTRGRGATYGASTPIALAGYRGVQFDGTIVGAKNVDHTGHFFIPFSPSSHAAGYFPDEYPVYGDVFQVMVVDVRGKTVVVYIENVGLPQERFPAFLEKADRILKTLRFPR